MVFEELTPNAEKLLQEIIDHRDEKGSCDSDYWKKKFDEINHTEDVRLRSLFKELCESEMISVWWADNCPYYLCLLDKGLSYKDMKKRRDKQAKKLSHREWRIAITSAIIGALVGLIPTALQWLGYVS